MLPNDTIGKLPFDVTLGIDPFSKSPSAGADSAGAGDVTPVGAGGQINSPQYLEVYKKFLKSGATSFRMQ